jgi:hypothetical protein
MLLNQLLNGINHPAADNPEMLRPTPLILRRTGIPLFKRCQPLSILYMFNHFLKINIMKKIFTLLFTVAMVAVASAQSKDFGHFQQVGNKWNQQQIQRDDHHYGAVIAPYGKSRNINAFEQSKQDRRFREDYYVQTSHGKKRFQTMRYQEMNRNFARNYRSRW